jgi:hypothetical protein
MLVVHATLTLVQAKDADAELQRSTLKPDFQINPYLE